MMHSCEQPLTMSLFHCENVREASGTVSFSPRCGWGYGLACWHGCLCHADAAGAHGLAIPVQRQAHYVCGHIGREGPLALASQVVVSRLLAQTTDLLPSRVGPVAQVVVPSLPLSAVVRLARPLLVGQSTTVCTNILDLHHASTV
jgi:hypothetical protein